MKTSVDEALLQAARGSLLVYMGLVHRTDAGAWEGHAVPARHHKVMTRALTDSGLGNTCIIMPRGAAKTTYMQGWIEWMLGRASCSGDKLWAHRTRFLYVSGSEGQAAKVSKAVKDTIEGNTQGVPYPAIFPKVKPKSSEWAQAEWKVAGNTTKDPTFQAVGLFGGALGSRVPYLLLDDPVTEDAKVSVTEMERIIGSPDAPGVLQATFLPILTPDGRALMTTTRWGWRDPAQWAEDAGWHMVFEKAIRDDGTSYWPEVWSVERLWEKKREVGDLAFAQQYQGEVAPAEGLSFERGWFRDRFDMLPTDEAVLARIDSWDNASGQGRNRSFTVGLSSVVTVDEKTGDPRIYVWEMDRGQLPYAYQREALLARCHRNRSDYVVVEQKSMGIALAQDTEADLGWNRRGERRLVEWHPLGQKGQTSKHNREQSYRDIQEFCGRGLVVLPSQDFCRRMNNTGWLYEFERDLFSYPNGETDDVVSALAQLVLWVLQNPQRLRAPRWETEERVFRLTRAEGARRAV